MRAATEAANCHKILSVRLGKLLYLLLYQHVLFSIIQVDCLSNVSSGDKNVRWLKSNASNRDYAASRKLYSKTEHKFIPRVFQDEKPANYFINDLQAEPSFISTLDMRNIYSHPMSKSLTIDGDMSPTLRYESQHQLLPNGPPPFRPLLLPSSKNSMAALEKLKRILAFKRMFKPKVYYLFLDTLRQLTLLAENLSRKNLAIANSKYAALQTIFNKLAAKGRHTFKLKWPLVLMNPQFLKELLSNPTFLIMLFHGVEVAYMSVPMNFWLKPLMKLIAQPSTEKEEKIWWRRKRLYDVLNGHGTSELQPNLKAAHFRHPGEPAKIAIPTLVHIYRKLTDRPAPNPSYHTHLPPDSAKHPIDNIISYPYLENSDHSKDSYMNAAQEEAFLSHQVDAQQSHKDSETAATTLVENETSDWPLEMMESSEVGHSVGAEPYLNHQLTITPTNQEDWLSHPPSEDQLMSQHEFDSLDPKERDMVLSEARKRYEESTWANELIKQHNDFIDSFAQGAQTPDQSVPPKAQDVPTNTDLSEPPREEDPESKRRHSIQKSI